MSVSGVTGNVENVLKGISGSLSFPAGPEFGSTLTVGQIIKGRVLRHYEGSRYLMDFGGQEKVVDSVVPLRTHDLIHGRVVAISERVELQRVHVDQGETPVAPAPDPQSSWLSDKAERLMQEMLNKYQGKLNANDNEVLLRAMRSVPNAQAMAVAGLALNKLGLPLTPELLRTVFSVWMSGPAREFPLNGPISQLAASPVEEVDVTHLQQFAQIIMRSLHDVPETRLTEGPTAKDKQERPTTGDSPAPQALRPQTDQPAGQSSDQSSDSSGFHLGRWLLNAQSDGTVGHRVGALPVYLGDQLVEIDIAIFEQRRGRTKEGVRYRQLVFSLDMENLGHVEVVARIADQRLRLRIVTEDSQKTDLASRYLGDLRGVLKAQGWQIDEAIYETRAAQDAQPGSVVGSVIEHLITQDSLSRLM